jgi:hypothetical protein
MELRTSVVKAIFKRADRSVPLTTNVRSGSKAALTALDCDFRHTPGSGHNSDIAGPFRATTGLVQCSKRSIISSVQVRCTARTYRPLLLVTASRETGDRQLSVPQLRFRS